MADCDFYHPEKKDPKMEAGCSVTGRFVVSYIGALGAANGVHHLIDCAEACQTSALSVQFIICGDGAMLAELKSISKQKALTNVTFIAFSNRAGVQRILNITDSVFVSYKKADILETGCPNKYFDGLAAGKLIIVNFGGWIRSEVELYKCGFFVDTRQSSAFVEKIKQFLSDRTLLEAAQRNSRELAERVYSRNEISGAFQRVFSDL